MSELRDTRQLLHLAAWLSPAFPTGAFAYSHGVEGAVHERLISSESELACWLSALVGHGSGWNDAVLLAEAWRLARGDAGGLRELAELAEALAPSRERRLETVSQGTAFASAAAVWPPSLARIVPDPCAYPVAVGALAGAHGLPLEAVLGVFLQAFCTGLIQAAIRLGVTGQQGGLRVLAGLEPAFVETARRARVSSLDDLGSATFLSDIVAMRHEMQPSRLFRS